MTRTTELWSVNQQKSAPFDPDGNGLRTEVALFDALGFGEWTGTRGRLTLGGE